MLGRSSRNFVRMSRVMPRQMGALGMIQFNSSPFHSSLSIFNQVYGQSTPSLMAPARFEWIQRRAFAKASATELAATEDEDILEASEKSGLNGAQVEILRAAKAKVIVKLEQVDALAQDLEDKWDIHMSTAQAAPHSLKDGKARHKARDLLAGENGDEIQTYLAAVGQLTATLVKLAKVKGGKKATNLSGAVVHFQKAKLSWRKRMTLSVFTDLRAACGAINGIRSEVIQNALTKSSLK